LYGIFLLVMAMMPGQVFAHAEWTKGSTTSPRQGENIKSGKCSGTRSTPMNGLPRISATAGSNLQVQFNEFIFHYGYYDINFSQENDSNFSFLKNVPHNLINEQARTSPKNYAVTLSMPKELCDDCTLQLIQEMWPEKTYVRPTNIQQITYYHSCTDIKLTPPNPNNGVTQDPVTALTAAPGDSTATLTWKQPTKNLDFYKILIIGNQPGITPATKKSDLMPQKQFKIGDTIPNMTQDVVVYVGKANTATILNLMNNNDYFFQVFAYDINLNYSEPTLINATPNTANVAPSIALEVTQGISKGTNVTQDGTDIIVSANVTDGNVNDKHTFLWVSNDFTDSDNLGNTFTIKGSEITSLPLDGTYNIAVTATDTGGLKGSSSVDITLKANSPPPSSIGNDVITNVADNGGCTI
ncbi:MAG: SCE4755 family polysaccharide monooxygenase-like protein, partial [Candidatus Heimdallarchaeota archaeon]